VKKRERVTGFAGSGEEAERTSRSVKFGWGGMSSCRRWAHIYLPHIASQTNKRSTDCVRERESATPSGDTEAAASSEEEGDKGVARDQAGVSPAEDLTLT
jgi:hypothetical protein